MRPDRIYHADATGQIQHHKPSWTVAKDGRVVENDAYGHPQHQKMHCGRAAAGVPEVEGVKIYETDAYGNVRRAEVRNQEPKIHVRSESQQYQRLHELLDHLTAVLMTCP